jgi:hypothetical protein
MGKQLITQCWQWRRRQDLVEDWNGVRFWFHVMRSFNFCGILVQLIHVRN